MKKKLSPEKRNEVAVIIIVIITSIAIIVAAIWCVKWQRTICENQKGKFVTGYKTGTMCIIEEN